MIADSRTLLTSVATLVLALIALLAAAAAPAGAGTFTLAPCVEVQNAWQRLGGPNAPEHWSFVDQCEFQWRFETSAATAFGGSDNWLFPARGLPVEAAEMRISGSSGEASGKTQGLRMCELDPGTGEPGTCGPLRTLTHGPETIEFSKLDGSIPGDDSHLVFTGRCDAPAGCPAGDAFDVSGTRLTLRDDEPPLLSAALEQPYGNNDFGPTEWHRAGPIVDFWATDSGSGVQQLLYRYYDLFNKMWVQLSVVPGGKNPLTQTYCLVLGADRSTPRFCAQDTSLELGQQWFYFQINTKDMLDGVNHVLVRAVDQADNASEPVDLELRVDNTPPATPAAPALVTTTPGWTHSPNARIQWTNTGETTESATQSGIAGVRYSLVPLSGQGGGVNIGTTAALDHFDVALPASGRWDVQFRTVDHAGNVSPQASVKFGYDPTQLAAPATAPDPALISVQELATSTAVSWQRPSNAAQAPSGICGYAMSVDTSQDGTPGSVINVLGDVTSAPLPPGLAEGDYWVHVRPVSCSGVTGGVATIHALVDLTAPDVGLIAPNAGWLAGSEPVSIVAKDAYTGVSRISYSIDNGPRVHSDGDVAQVNLAEGVHVLAFQSEDAAGNRSAEHVTSLSADRTAPTAMFEPFDPGRPAIVRVRVSDRGSGVASVAFEYRRKGTAGWTSFPTRRFVSADAAGESIGSAALPDADIPPGPYELRATATDRAGHKTETGVYANGTPVNLLLPLRDDVQLTAGFADATHLKCISSRAICANVSRGRYVVDYGRGSRFAGRLTAPDGSPLRSAEVRLWEGPNKDSMTDTGRIVKTDHAGRYAFRLRPGPSRSVEARFAGTDTLLKARNLVELLTRAKLTFAVRTTRRHGAYSFVFSGRVFAAGVQFPPQGKSVVVQLRTPMGWRDYPAKIATDRTGRFHVRVPYGRVSRPLKFVFRASSPIVAGWPYYEGFSATAARTLR